MKSSHAVLAVAFLIAAVVLMAPASSAAAYHSFTWDQRYTDDGIDVSTNAGDRSRIPDGFQLEVSIQSDVYDTSAMSVHFIDPEGKTLKASYSESGLYRLVVEDDIVLVLKNFIELPVEAQDPLPDDTSDVPETQEPLPDDTSDVPETQEPLPDDTPEVPVDQPASEPYTPETASGSGWDGETSAGAVLSVSVCAAAAVLIYGVFAATFGGSYHGKP